MSDKYDNKEQFKESEFDNEVRNLVVKQYNETSEGMSIILKKRIIRNVLRSVSDHIDSQLHSPGNERSMLI